MFHFDPPATSEEIHAAAQQYVRKLSGFPKPSQVNEKAFTSAIEEIATATEKLLQSLQTDAAYKNREIEADKRRERFKRRLK